MSNTPQPDFSPSTPTRTSRAERVFLGGSEFVFPRAEPTVEMQLKEPLTRAFSGLTSVDVDVRAVATTDGSELPIYVLVVTYRLPPEVPFGALASEIGREFLSATPHNSSPTLNGNGVYMRERRGGRATESVAFFIGREIFVYAFGATQEAPTAEVAQTLFRTNCRRVACDLRGRQLLPTGSGESTN